MRKNLKLFFTDFWSVFDIKNNFFLDILNEKYEIEVTRKEPDFLFYSVFGTDHNYFNCPKIFYTGENVRANFNECDYAITFDYMENEPRHFRMPLYPFFDDCKKLLQPKNPEEILKQKTKFCCFINSNPTPQKRIKFFKKLSNYKKVDSGGRVLNNIGYRVGDKIEFMKQYKFTIAYENMSYPGYTTEKIFEPMLSHSLPIYWGNPSVDKDFNTKSFLNYYDFENEEALIEKIIELDNNDELYLSYLRQPYFNNNELNEFVNPQNILEHLDNFFSKKIIPVSAGKLIFTSNPMVRLFAKLLIESAYKFKRLLLKIKNFNFRKLKYKLAKF